jgi:hypothetical protein
MKYLVKIKIFVTKVKRFGVLHLTSVFDYFLFQFGVPERQCKFKISEGKRSICFLGENLWPRVSRMAKWIKKDFGFEITLVCSSAGFNKKFSHGHFDHIITFRNKWHLRRILSQLKGMDLIHSFGPKNEYPAMATLYYKGNVIYDAQDVLCCYYGLNPGIRWIKNDIFYENINFTQSKGLVAQGPEPIIGRKFYNTKKPPSLFFPLYCDDDAFTDPTAKRIKEGEIHLVYAGGIAGSHRDPLQYGSTQFFGLIEKLSNQKIHFHIYPSPLTPQVDCFEYEKNYVHNHYFHFHPAVAQDELPGELAKYHFGIVPFFSGQNKQSNYKYKYATALKLFNYIEAGIPVITSEDMFFQNWIVKRYKCGISINEGNLNDLRKSIESYHYVGLIENLIQGRNRLSLRRQIPRLVSFYDKINQQV